MIFVIISMLSKVGAHVYHGLLAKGSDDIATCIFAWAAFSPVSETFPFMED